MTCDKKCNEIFKFPLMVWCLLPLDVEDDAFSSESRGLFAWWDKTEPDSTLDFRSKISLSLNSNWDFRFSISLLKRASIALLSASFAR